MQGSEAGSGGATQRAEQTSLDLFNWAAIGRFFQLVARSMARHKRVLFSVWLGVVGASVGLMAALPKTYEVQTTLQAQRTDVIAALSNRPNPGSDPSKQAAETVLRHENLVSLVQQTDLIRKWPERRAPAMRLKDAIFARLFPPRTPDEQLEGFVGLLEKQLWVDSNQGTVSIGIHFPDPDLAFSLVDTALENFLEARHAAEISSIGDAIVVLENRAAKSREALDATREQLETLRAARAAKVGKPGGPRRVLPLESETPLDGKTSQLLVQVQSRRRAIADLQEFRRRRATELEARLEELRSQYSASHPSVLDAQQSLEAMRGDSPQVLALQRELVPMEAELKQRGLAADVPLRTSRVRERLGTLQLDAEDPREAEDPDIEYAKSQVRAAIARYNGLLDRVESARLEQDSAQAAFKYRYTVIKPPQKPRGPVKPKPALVIPASVVAGLLLGIIATALIDLWSRKLVEPWQVEHALGIPLLGEVRGL